MPWVRSCMHIAFVASALVIPGLLATMDSPSDFRPTNVHALSPGTIDTFAGNGAAGFVDGSASSAEFSFPYGIAADTAGNIYVADNGNSRVRKISAGNVTTIAGNGSVGYTGDGGPATSAAVGSPTDVAFDGNGNLYFSDQSNCVVRMVNTAGIISTVAGSGACGFTYSGEGGPATQATFKGMTGIAISSAGEAYIADNVAYRVFKVGTDGIVRTVAGSGTNSGFQGANSGDGGPATAAAMLPFDVALDGSGGFYVADAEDCRVRQVNSGGILSTVAGIGDQTAALCGSDGDGGPAVNGKLSELEKIAVAPDGTLYIGDSFNCRVRRVRNGVLATVAGVGSWYLNGCGFSGDGGPSVNAAVRYPTGMVLVGSDLYFADSENNRIRTITDVTSIPDPPPPPPTPAQPENVFGSQGSNPSAPISDEPVNLATGNYTYQYTDVSIHTKGYPLAFMRSYNSQDTFSGSLGAGWRTNLSIQLLFDDADHSTANVTAVTEEGRQDDYARRSDGGYVQPPGILDVLARNSSDGGFQLRRKDRSKLLFNSDGVLQSILDRNGNTTAFSYTAALLTSMTDPSGRTLTFSYDANNRLQTATDPLGRVTAYAYDAAGNLTSVTDSAAHVRSYTYDANHQLLTITDPLGHVVVTNVYTNGKVTQQTDALGNVWSYVYNSGATTETDARGCARTFNYDVRYRETQYVDCLNNTMSFTYDAFGNRNSVTDPLGHATLFTYDGRGNPVAIEDPLGNTQTFSFDNNDDLLATTDPLGHQTTFTYGANGNLTSETNALNKVTSYDPNVDGTLASVTDPLAHTTSFLYDAYGNTVSATDALAHTTTSTYDLGGRLLTVTDPLAHTTTYTYDNQNNVLSATDPLLHVTTMTYDAKGQRTAVTDANGKTTAYAYDFAGNLTTITDPLNQTVTYAYDANNNRTGMTNTRGKTTTYAYDAVNRLLTITDPIGKLTQYTYDAAGKVIRYKDPRRSAQALSRYTSYTYDAANRLTNVAYPDIHYSTGYTYDAAGNRLTMIDARSVCDVTTGCPVNTVASDTTTYAYDALNRLASVQTTFKGAKLVTYGYDDAGRRSSITYPDLKVVTYGYDAADRLTTVTPNWLPAATSYTYDAADRLTNTARPNGLASDRTYDNAGRLLSVLNRNGGAPISSFIYTLDNMGNRTQVADTSGTTTYGYDDLYRLTAATYPNGDTQAYTYDAMGNRLTMVNNGATTTYGYDNADRLTQLNGVNNSLDDNGNLLALGIGTNLANTFQFDQEDRVHRAGPCRSDINGDGISNSIDGLIIAARYGSHGSTVFDLLADLNNDSKINTADAQIQAGEFGKQCKNTGPNTGNERSWFNGDGLRVGERTFPFPQASVTRDFTWDVGASLPVILQETRTQGGVPATVSYVYGLDLISATDSAAGTAYLLNDGHGSTSELTDGAGAVMNTYTYDVFGALRSSSGTTANDFLYTGQQQDYNANRGMYYLRARTYDPALGRFLQKDRLPLLQRYAYVGNNPVNRIDPSGLQPDTPTPVVGARITKGERHKRCLQGFVECEHDLVKQAKDKWGPLEPFPGYFRSICGFMLLRCEQQSTDGSFDFGLARKQMGLDVDQAPWWSRLLDAIPIPRINLPSTGSGGYIHQGDKETASSCSF